MKFHNDLITNQSVHNIQYQQLGIDLNNRNTFSPLCPLATGNITFHVLTLCSKKGEPSFGSIFLRPFTLTCDSTGDSKVFRFNFFQDIYSNMQCLTSYQYIPLVILRWLITEYSENLHFWSFKTSFWTTLTCFWPMNLVCGLKQMLEKNYQISEYILSTQNYSLGPISWICLR